MPTVEVGNSKKFQPPYRGPYTITQVKNKNVVVLQHCASGKIMTPVNVSRLKYFKQFEHLPSDPAVADEGREKLVGPPDELLTEVESIKRMRTVAHGRQYLIKWKGLDNRSNTWLDVEDLVNCKEALAEFHRTCLAVFVDCS